MANGSIAQLGEHLPYKQRVTGSSPVTPTTYGLVVQLVRTLACHARGRGFEPLPGRHFFFSLSLALDYAFVAQLVEQRTENPRVVGSIPTEGTICGFSSSGRAPPCQGGGSEFEPRNPLQKSIGDLSGAFFACWKNRRGRAEILPFFCHREGETHPVNRSGSACHVPAIASPTSAIV